MQILITGNCQRYPLASALGVIFPYAQIVTTDLAQTFSDETTSSELELVAGSLVWITQGTSSDAARILSALSGPKPHVLRIPVIGFAAFHPDICLVSHGTNQSSVYPHFHSTIVAWSYRRGLPVKSAMSLFNEQTFEALGYYQAWEQSVQYLRQSFEDSDLANEFEHFFLSVKRHGMFMHTFNHPNTMVIHKLSQIIAKRLNEFHLEGLTQELIDVREDDSAFENVLSTANWPLYPEIGAHLGIDGGEYCWKFEDQSIVGLEPFIRFMYESYRSQGIAFTDLQILNRSLSQLDRVLMPSVKSSS
jgi:hypothetical protein